MAPKNNESITSYFQPAGEAKGKSKAVIKSTEESNPNTSKATSQSHPQTKGKGKRQTSSSPLPPTKKRPNTTSTPTTQPSHLAYTDIPSNWLQDTPANDSPTLHLTHHKGDLFAAPAHTLLIHACNTQGHWGAGIAKAFKSLYPAAYRAHHAFCAKAHDPKTKPVPTGTSQLLAPVDGSEHWIGCVFTSAKYGRAKDKPDAIVRNSVAAVEMLLELVRVAKEAGEEVGVVRMCKINSGKFGVPWERTEEALRGIVLREGWPGEIEVWEPREEV
ncbi:hypothetical protein CC86DRAFT_368181 [Ophiobolus disseminans]|uniref:ADP-ribose 1''-phosphate phosphatase n=1 Tax=Ophiobolus disseminans TaxID=1469910 RepID=A0A6A7A8Q9_9PLEO|nr:hypothetical protein CC86DRAFT_368181 [Ophiobolus disseminans]